MKVYMDNAATTAISETVLQAMLPWLKEGFGNPSSLHSWGREARRALGRARRQVAAALGAGENEIFFTSGGTESDNWALRGIALQRARPGHIVTTQIEHHAVLNTCRALEKLGWRVTYIKPDALGFIDPGAVEAALEPDTALVSVMAVNNEIGAVEPIAEIAAICRGRGVPFHTDAVQAVGHIPLNVNCGIDMLSLSGHKLHAPKGVGVLYMREGVRVASIMTGGEQESKRRAGTENVASIVGLGVAIEQACADIARRGAELAQKRDYMLGRILGEIPETRLNGPRENRAPGNLNISFRCVEGEALLLNLDLKGIAASSGSACASGSPEPSHVLAAIGLSRDEIASSLRFSLGDSNTLEEIDYTVEVLKEAVARLRSLSPEWAEIAR